MTFVESLLIFQPITLSFTLLSPGWLLEAAMNGLISPLRTFYLSFHGPKIESVASSKCNNWDCNDCIRVASPHWKQKTYWWMQGGAERVGPWITSHCVLKAGCLMLECYVIVMNCIAGYSSSIPILILWWIIEYTIFWECSLSDLYAVLSVHLNMP